jgi:hypothetical protein
MRFSLFKETLNNPTLPEDTGIYTRGPVGGRRLPILH